MTYLFKEEPNADAFGRQRVATIYTLGDYKHLYGLDPNFNDKKEFGGNVSYLVNEACARLSTNNSPVSNIVHQTKFYHHYMPGKSQLIYSSFNMYAPTANVTKRTGYFDDENGIFLEQNGNGTLSWIVRSFVTGIPTETRVNQSNWNADVCDGSGVSGFGVDITKTQLIFIDFQWLGVGKVRCGFVHDGSPVLAHEFKNSNNIPTVYMSNPNLPVRCEVRNNGITTGGFMDQICSTVISEGGYVEAGQDWSATTSSLVTIASGASKPVMAIRLKQFFHNYKNRMIVRMGNLNVFSDGDNISWKLIKLSGNASLTANVSAWTNVNTNSGVEYNQALTAYTGGEEMDNGFVGASTQGSHKAGGSPASNIPSTAKKNFIVQNFDANDSEIFLVWAKNLGSQSTNVGIGMQWREVY
jgi:hypothetical protein